MPVAVYRIGSPWYYSGLALVGFELPTYTLTPLTFSLYLSVMRQGNPVNIPFFSNTIAYLHIFFSKNASPLKSPDFWKCNHQLTADQPCIPA